MDEQEVWKRMAAVLELLPAALDGQLTRDEDLTETGWAKLVGAAPGHVEHVRGMVFDQLTPEQVSELSDITTQLLKKLDPEGRMFASLGK